MAQFGIDHGWSGIIVCGCVCDADTLKSMEIGNQALNNDPAESAKLGGAQREIEIQFGGV